MPSNSVAVDIVRLWAPANLRKVAAGTAVCAAVAAVAYWADTRGLTHFEQFFVPPLIIALAIGMALQPLSARPAVGSSRVDLQACKLEYSIVSPK